MPSPFPAGFLWGTATSSYQVEGDNTGCDWYEWEQAPGRISGNQRCGDACRWWAGRAESDLEAARQSGQNAHRLSLEWSRLEPAPGEWNEEAFARYRRLLEWMRSVGLTPMVTLYHFTLPQWVAAAGGWSCDDTPRLLARFASEAGRRLGDLVPLWVTVNEPFSLVYHAYFAGRWPPGRRPLPEAIQAGRRLQEAHDRAYQALRQACPDSKVGVSMIMQRIRPASRGWMDGLIARTHDHLSIEAWLAQLRTGRPQWPYRYSPGSGRADLLDFIGVNYYGTYDLKFDPRQPSCGRWVHEGGVTHGSQDWGRPDPEGLLHQIRRAAALRVPVYVTETGIFDPTDERRCDHLPGHVAAVARALGEGIDVRGFFYWSLMDNFEWAEGWDTPFGLIGVDPETQLRHPRPSFELYGRIARTNGLPVDQYAANAAAVKRHH